MSFMLYFYIILERAFYAQQNYVKLEDPLCSLYLLHCLMFFILLKICTWVWLLIMDKSQNYTLEELLAQCNPSDDFADKDVEWFDAKPVDRELL